MFTNQIVWHISSYCKYHPVCLINFSYYKLHKSRSVEQRLRLQIVLIPSKKISNNQELIQVDFDELHWSDGKTTLSMINQCHYCQNHRRNLCSDTEVFSSMYYLWHYYYYWKEVFPLMSHQQGVWNRDIYLHTGWIHSIELNSNPPHVRQP